MVRTEAVEVMRRASYSQELGWWPCTAGGHRKPSGIQLEYHTLAGAGAKLSLCVCNVPLESRTGPNVDIAQVSCGMTGLKGKARTTFIWFQTSSRNVVFKHIGLDECLLGPKEP